jgi:hypothetical protein
MKTNEIIERSRKFIAPAAAVIDALAELDLRYAEVSEAQRQELAVAKEELLANDVSK